MNSKTTCGLIVLAAGLFAYIVFFERRSLDSAERAEQAAQIFPDFDPTQITSIEIHRTTNLLLRAERADEQWRLAHPLYPAEPVRIENFLRAVEFLKAYSHISRQELSSYTNARASFGLDPPQATVTLRTRTNGISFLVGIKTITGEHLYLQRIGDTRVGVTDARFLAFLPASAEEWRNPLLLQSERLAFDRLTVTNGPSVFEVRRDATNQLWRMEKPLSARADRNGINLLIQQLRDTRVSQFVTDDPKADLDKYGLQPPAMELALALGTNPVFQLQFGNSPTNEPGQVFARRLSHSNIVLVPKTLVDRLRKPHEEFRDHTFLSFSTSAVDRIEVQLKDKQPFALALEAGRSWRIVAPTNAPADPVSVASFFENLARLEIIRFEADSVTDFSAYGLAPPVRQYTLKTTATNATGITNRILAQIDIGAMPTNSLDRVFARRADEASFVYSVSSGATQLPQAAYEMRSRRIWSFASSNVTSVTIAQNGRTNTLARDARRAWSSDRVTHEAIEETLHLLGELEADSWANKGDEIGFRMFGFKENPYQIVLGLNTGGTAQTLSLSFGRPGSRVYAAVVLEEGQPVIFRFPTSVFRFVEQNLNAPPSSPIQ
jgi:hypothetical protein